MSKKNTNINNLKGLLKELNTKGVLKKNPNINLPKFSNTPDNEIKNSNNNPNLNEKNDINDKKQTNFRNDKFEKDKTYTPKINLYKNNSNKEDFKISPHIYNINTFQNENESNIYNRALKNKGPFIKEEILNENNKKIRKFEQTETKNDDNYYKKSHHEILKETEHNNYTSSQNNEEIDKEIINNFKKDFHNYNNEIEKFGEEFDKNFEIKAKQLGVDYDDPNTKIYKRDYTKEYVPQNVDDLIKKLNLKNDDISKKIKVQLEEEIKKLEDNINDQKINEDGNLELDYCINIKNENEQPKIEIKKNNNSKRNKK